jgi:magnesium-transporting ATPase (P-type)
VHHYLPHEAFVNIEAFYAFFRYFLLMATCVPISLMVSLEVCKAIQSYYIMNDCELVSKDPKREGKSASVAQPNIVEELG